MKTILMMIIFCAATILQAQPQGYIYGNGTNWDNDFYQAILESDPSAFDKAIFTAEQIVDMWDRDAKEGKGDRLNVLSYVYRLVYDDDIASQIRIRKEDFTRAEADALALKYGQKMGQLPAVLRADTKQINILKSDALFGGNKWNKSIEITIGKTSELYEKTGNMEETLFHEATHAALDSLYLRGWQQNRDGDSKFISKYASDNPNREDISESFIVYAMLNYRNSRIREMIANNIKQTIPNRLAFFEQQNYNMYPMTLPTEVSTVADFDPNKVYRLRTGFTGEDKSLDIINDGQNNRLIMGKTGNYSGQAWKIESLGNDHYRLTTQFTGTEKSLDVINDDQDNKLIMGQTGNYSGQAWKIEKLPNGYYRLTNQFTGADKSLDIINDQEKNKIILAPTGNYTGQYWEIMEWK